MTEKNEIKDIVDELVKLRVAIGGLTPDPTKTIDAQQAETQATLVAAQGLATFTRRLVYATWALVLVSAALAGATIWQLYLSVTNTQ